MYKLREMLDRLTTPSYSTGLFTDAWRPRESPVRRRASPQSRFSRQFSTHLGHASAPPTLTLAGQTFTFTAGHWVGETASSRTHPRATTRGSSREPKASFVDLGLEEKVHSLEEENNALTLRVEVLLDMLAEAMADYFVVKHTLEDTEKALAKRGKKRQEMSQ